MSSDRPFVDRPVSDIAAAGRVARAAADLWGLPAPTLMRRGMNALYICGDVIVRVGNTTANPSLAHRVVGVMRDHGVATVPPIEGFAAVIDGLGVTGWERVERTTSPVDWAQVGAAVRRVHDVLPDEIPRGYPLPSPAAFPWWDFHGLLDEVGPDIDGPALKGLRTTVDRHEGWRTDIEIDAVVCHGDVHPGNVLMAADGPRLVDWDLLCTASPAWDHAMLTTYADRWGGCVGTYEDFAEGYGASLADDPVTQAVADLRNVAATLMRVRAGRDDPAAASEAERRLRYWRGDPGAPVWRAQ